MRCTRGVNALLFIAAVTFIGCERVDEVVEYFFDDSTPRERYEIRLERAGITGTALMLDWRAAAERALREAPAIRTPYREEGYLPPGEPDALAFRIPVRRGQHVQLDVELYADTAAMLFLDAWQVLEDTVVTYRHIASADSGSRTLDFEPRRNGDYVLRMQPELLRGGRYAVTLVVDPTLAFPVEGAAERDIGSVFGDPRDGGVRRHHGIDIFAPRGTPALAAAEATVSRVRTTPVGGRVVWLRDRRGNSLYYAHLDSQNVARGATVKQGDTVGFVGNTGNARTTPPHLHFGVYSRGPVDPYWFVHEPAGSVPRLTADTVLLGGWARTPRERTLLRATPDVRAAVTDTLDHNTAVRVVAAVGSWYRVRLPDGVAGFLDAGLAEGVEQAVELAAAESRTAMFSRPLEPAHVIDEVSPGDTLAVLGRFGEYLLVRPGEGRPGWIAQRP